MIPDNHDHDPEIEDDDIAEPGSFYDATGLAYNRESYFRQGF